MNEAKFKRYLELSKLVNGEYSTGYQRGLRRHFHGQLFGTETEHEKWFNLHGRQQEKGNGYRDGFAGKSPQGIHGMTGLRNKASGAINKSTKLQIRMTPEFKERIAKASAKRGIKISEFVEKVLAEAIIDNAQD